MKKIEDYEWTIVKYINKKGEEIASKDLYIDGNYVATIPETGYINTFIRDIAVYQNETLELSNLK